MVPSSPLQKITLPNLSRVHLINMILENSFSFSAWIITAFNYTYLEILLIKCSV